MEIPALRQAQIDFKLRLAKAKYQRLLAASKP